MLQNSRSTASAILKLLVLLIQELKETLHNHTQRFQDTYFESSQIHLQIHLHVALNLLIMIFS